MATTTALQRPPLPRFLLKPIKRALATLRPDLCAARRANAPTDRGDITPHRHGTYGADLDSRATEGAPGRGPALP
jgi:hypothetical protein